MAYQIYIAENCHECEEVVEKLKSIPHEVVQYNVDTGEIKPPIPTFAYPALFSDKVLLAYGSDIIEYLKAKS